MRKRCLLAVAITLSVGCGKQPLAQTLERTFSLSEVVADHETRAAVRMAILGRMRLMAADEAGSVIETTTTLTQAGLTEEIRQVGVSVVRVVDIKDRLRLDERGRAVLEVTARLAVDQDELRRRARVMEADRSRLEEVRRLMAENRALADRGSRAGQEGETAKASTAHARLEDNIERLGRVFAPGALKAAAVVGADSEQSAIEAMVQEIHAALTEAPVVADIERTAAGMDGVIVDVRVGWEVDGSRIERSIRELVRRDFSLLRGTATKVWVDEAHSPAGTRVARKALEKLSEQDVHLVVEVGGQTVDLPVLYRTRDGFEMDACRNQGERVGDGQVFVCIVAQQPKAQAVRGARFTQNPVTIQLTDQQAKTATGVDVWWRIGKDKDVGRRQEARRQVLAR